MVDSTKTLNTNLEDLTQVLENMDSLEMELLNDSFKNTRSVTSTFRDSNAQLDGDLKRKVMLKDIHEDDSLTSLLLDDEASLKEKKSFLTSGSKSSLIEDLFKIKTPATSSLVIDENIPARDVNVLTSKSEENLPEWLGGTKKFEEKKSNEVKEVLRDNLPNDVKTKPLDKDIVEHEGIKSSTNSKVPDEHNLAPEDMSLLFGAQFNQQTAILTMQQQEHELRTAGILSQQNEQLNKVSDAQQFVLHNQEKQFNSLLKLQFERQVLLEKQIKTQQERINQYIQTLMGHPTPISSTTSVYTSFKDEQNEMERNTSNEKEELEKRIKILQAEKSKLESLLDATNERHNNEVTCQVEFYERQISFLKEGMLKFEERVRQEIEVLETDYIAKLEKLRNEKVQMENLHKEEIHNLKNEHVQHMQELKELHSQNVKFLQKEYSSITESICKAKQVEDQIMETITTRKIDVENMLQNANSILENMRENKEKIELKDIELTERRENYLKAYEDDIKAQKVDLKNQTNILKEDHNKFVETVETFSTQLTQLMGELQKQTTYSNRTQEMFENKTAHLLKERELFEEKVKWEREYLQTLKESWTKEHDRQLQLLQQEREAITAEKAQLQTMNRLKFNSDDIAKVELEAAIQTAQEAAACANHKKLQWQEKMNELNVHKQILQDKENLLVLRAKELEKLTQSALAKKHEGMKALEDAKHLESQHKEALALLQMQLKAFMEKEKKINSEQYSVFKGQTISLSCESEKPERDTNVSHSFNHETLPFSVIPSTSQITSELMKIVDPNLTMLKLSFDDHYDSIT